MKRKILYPIIFIVIAVLGYLNYYREEPGITEVKSVVETKNIAYETSGYFIEAEKQLDDLKTKDTVFEKASAKFKDMVLSGDNILLNSAKNLFLKNHIIGKSGKEWEFFTEQLDYDSLKDAITSNSGIKVVNKIQDIQIESKNLKTNSKFDFIELDGNVEIKNKVTELFSDKARYVDETKVIILNENGKFKTKTNDNKEIIGNFKKARYNSETNILELFNKFTINYEGVTLTGTKMWYNDKSKIFLISNNPKIVLGGYKISSKEIRNPDGKDIIYIKGKISGTNGDISFVGNKGYYNTTEKKLYILGNVQVTSKNGEKVLAEKVIYDTNIKTADFIGKNQKVVYTFEDRKATAKKVVYNTETRMFYLDDGYKYEDKIYKSHGQKMDYNFATKKGVISKGILIVKSKNEKAKGDTITFDMKTRDYTLEGNGEINNGFYVFKSEKLDYLNSKGFANLLEPFTILNLKDNSIISGTKGKYDIKKQEFSSDDKVMYSDKLAGIIVTGDDFYYNLKSETGKITKRIRYENKKDGVSFTGDIGSFVKDKYVKIKENLKIETTNEEIFAETGSYDAKTKLITIPNEINFNSKDGKSKGTIFNGFYNVESKKLIGKNLDLITDKNETVTSKNCEYNIDSNELILKNSVKVKTEDLILTSESLEYNIKTKEAKTFDKFRLLYDKNFKITGNSCAVNTIKESIKGKDIRIISDKNEEFISDKVDGNIKDMRFDLIGNVKGKIFDINQKSGKIIPVNYQGDYVRVYFKKENSNYKVIRIEGRDNSIITRENEKFYSDYIEMDLLKNIVYAGKNNKASIEDEFGKTELKGDSFNLDGNTNLININGNVFIENKDKKNEVTILKGNSSKIDKNANTVEIENNVEVENNKLILKADKIICNKSTDKVKAFGNVKVNYKVKGAN